ncbi:ABC transporter permease [Hypericibacter sp.]|uniref:ABC transporter permease n=1 Tax=Hypericibacter sp. TaxID=2705401 RepID=UPI003D6CE3C2
MQQGASAELLTARAGASRRPSRPGGRHALPAFFFLFFLFVVPLSVLLLRSVTDPVPGLGNYVELLTDETYARVLFNTFMVAGIVTVVSLLLGYPVAWLLVILPSRVSRWLFAILLLSMWTNLVARTYAWLVLLQRTGVINRALMAIGVTDHPIPLVNNLIGVTIGMTYIMLPFVVFPLQTRLATLDPAIMQVAAISGARPSQVFFRVLLPLSLPGIYAGGLMVFVMALGYYVTPAMLGGTSNMMLAELIGVQVQTLLNWGLGSAAAFILLSVTLVLYALYVRSVGFGQLK